MDNNVGCLKCPCYKLYVKTFSQININVKELCRFVRKKKQIARKFVYLLDCVREYNFKFVREF